MVDIDIKSNKIVGNKMYPKISNEIEPSAPSIEMEVVDNGHSYRLQKISEVLNFLKKEISERERLNKKYARMAKVVDNVEGGLVVVSLALGGAGVILLSTVAAAPVAVGLEAAAGVIGLSSLVSKVFVRKTTTKAEKHLKIQTLAASKLNTIDNHVSKALMDNHISDDEFKLIMEEMDKYEEMKSEIRTKFKKKMTTEDKESLIEKGRQEARESFRRLVENKHGGELPY